MKIGDRKEFLKAFTVKSLHWEYEQERRIIKTERAGGPKAYRFAPGLLLGVILGQNISTEDEKQVCGWVDKSGEKIKIYKAQRDRKNFKIIIPELDLENKIQ